MKASQFFISTLKEAPADAEVASHQLMMRAGLIKKLGAGIYNYMPMGLRVIRKVEAIVREEMNRAGAVEMTMPVIQPAELWQETGRFEQDGPGAAAHQGPARPRLRGAADQRGSRHRHGARQEIKSYKQLPKNFYQIQTKFRDERRPRFGSDARARVHHEGRLQLRPRPGLLQKPATTGWQPSLSPHLRPLRPDVIAR